MRTSHIAGGSVLALALMLANTATAEVWVITDSQHPVTGASNADRLIDLDTVQRIEAELSAQLPSDPERAAVIARQRLQQGGPGLQQYLQVASQGIADAWSLGITTLPAVVVDQRYVIYGETNLDRALTRIAQHRQVQP